MHVCSCLCVYASVEVRGVINIGVRKESFRACIFVHAEVAGRWMHANVHVLCTVHVCMGVVVDGDTGERGGTRVRKSC